MGSTELPFCWTGLCCKCPKTKDTEIGEPDINKIGEKFQDNNEFILHNDLRNSRGN